MKTLINKHNPAIRITAPEIKRKSACFGHLPYFQVTLNGEKFALHYDQWTLVEEEPMKKEQPQEELVYRLNGLMIEYVKEGKDDAEKEHRFKCYRLFWDALEDADFFEQKEQKPAEWSEKHIADIFEKVGLAKIVREQGNDALTNAVQSAMIELSKTKSAEWSDEDNLRRVIRVLEDNDSDWEELSNWLKSLRRDSSDVDFGKTVEFECIGKKVKMTVQELIDYYIDSECADVADECGF